MASWSEFPSDMWNVVALALLVQPLSTLAPATDAAVEAADACSAGHILAWTGNACLAGNFAALGPRSQGSAHPFGPPSRTTFDGPQATRGGGVPPPLPPPHLVGTARSSKIPQNRDLNTPSASCGSDRGILSDEPLCSQWPTKAPPCCEVLPLQPSRERAETVLRTFAYYSPQATPSLARALYPGHTIECLGLQPMRIRVLSALRRAAAHIHKQGGLEVLTYESSGRSPKIWLLVSSEDGAQLKQAQELEVRLQLGWL